MQIFLKEVATQILENYPNNLPAQKLIFPNRRSALFFKKYLSELIVKPTFAPGISTINELFKSSSPLKVVDPLQLTFKMFDSYKKLHVREESFDEFFYWGEMIVNDFDDIDKYLVDHSILFQNLKDLKNIDDSFGGLEPEIIEIIRKFWMSFDPSNITAEKEDFLAVWDILANLYESYRSDLRKFGIAYEGMVMRDLIENLRSGRSEVFTDEYHYHFIGFNALNLCEKELLLYLKKHECASFYWDHDNLYVNNEEHEAGLFIRDNLRVFGQDLKGRLRFDILEGQAISEDKLEVYKAPSDVAQAKLIPALLEDFGDISSKPEKTAIVLADENMLMPVINSVPTKVDSINVTMGYPLYQTPVYSLINQLLSLQRNKRKNDRGEVNFYYADIERILGHQYITHTSSDQASVIISDIKERNLIRVVDNTLKTSDFFVILFSAPEKYRDINNYLIEVLSEVMMSFGDSGIDTEDESPGEDKGSKIQQEYIYTIVKALKQLDTLFGETEISFSAEIYSRITDRLIRKLIIPFSGEPLNGLQVMGILETRALDFENIIILSVNEGVLPKGSSGNTYIPHNLRMAFGLPTVKHQDSIFAYYFYRLIQRAQKVKFIYNSSSSGMRTGEMSRFLLQLKYNPDFNTRFTDTRFNILPPAPDSDHVIRTDSIHKFIRESYLDGAKKRKLSPSALNTWINCRIKFYYKYIVGLKESEGVKEDIDSPMFGTILHNAMNELYKPWRGKQITENQIKAILKDDKLISENVEKAFREVFMKNNTGQITGKNLIITTVMEDMIAQILEIDSFYAPFEILELEKFYERGLEVSTNSGSESISLGGTIDRIDLKGNSIRILDYKSGKDSLVIESLEDLTSYNSKNRNSAAFQTLLYSWIYGRQSENMKVRPSLYPVRAIYNEKFTDVFSIKKGECKGPVDNHIDIMDGFVEGLQAVIGDLFDNKRNFEMTGVKESCTYCSFNDLCGRKEIK